MQPDSSITFISPKNKRVWAGKRRELARREEVLRNIARQAGMPPLPQSRGTRLIRVYAGCARVGAVLASICIWGLVIMWFVSVLDSLFRHFIDLIWMACVVGLSSQLLFGGRSVTQRVLDQLIYPSCVIGLYQRLITSRQLVIGEIQSVETLLGPKYLLHYQFTLPTNNQNVTGQYETSQQFPVGTKVAVIYLDTSCHVLL